MPIGLARSSSASSTSRMCRRRRTMPRRSRPSSPSSAPFPTGRRPGASEGPALRSVVADRGHFQVADRRQPDHAGATPDRSRRKPEGSDRNPGPDAHPVRGQNPRPDQLRRRLESVVGLPRWRTRIQPGATWPSGGDFRGRVRSSRSTSSHDRPPANRTTLTGTGKWPNRDYNTRIC